MNTVLDWLLIGILGVALGFIVGLVDIGWNSWQSHVTVNGKRVK